MEHLLELDQALFQAINLGSHPAWLDQTMLFLSSHAPWLTVAALILAVALWKRDKRLLVGLLLVGLAVGVSDVVTYELLKPGFARARPCHQPIEFRLVQPSCGSDWGFPSNHAANGAAITTAVGLYFRRRGLTVGVALVTLVVALSRSYLGAHFPGDLLAGFAVGGCVAAATWVLLRRIPAFRVLSAA